MAKIPLPQDFKDLLKLLHAHGVRHLLIGGWAVGYHGYPRNTADIDIWIAVDQANCQAVTNMLKEFIGQAPSPADFFKRPYILRMGVPPNRVEILTDIAGVDFEHCFANRVSTTIDKVPVTLIGLTDLIANKKAAGRDKDISDAKQLQQLHKPEKRKKKL